MEEECAENAPSIISFKRCLGRVESPPKQKQKDEWIITATQIKANCSCGNLPREIVTAKECAREQNLEAFRLNTVSNNVDSPTYINTMCCINKAMYSL